MISIRAIFLTCIALASNAAPTAAQPNHRNAVFEPGTPLDVVAAQLNPPSHRFDTDPAQRWPGALGTPTTITWSLAADGAAYDDGEVAFTNELFARFDNLFTSDRTLWISLIQQSFDRWEALTGIDFVRVTAPGSPADDGAASGAPGNGATRGDIRIFLGPIDGPGKTLALAAMPPDGGDIALDRAELWAFADSNYRYFRNILMRQIGHAIGLRTACPVQQLRLMEPFVVLSFDGPQHDDIRGAQWLYGDPFEPSDTSATTADAGTINIGPDVLFGVIPAPAVTNSGLLSLHSTNDVDLIRFELTGPRRLQLVATPRGTTYDDSGTGCGGTAGCCSGNFINSATVGALTLELLGADAATVLATADPANPGQPATLSFSLESPGVYYARITASVVAGESLLYRLTLTARSDDCNNNGVDDLADIASGFSQDCNANLVPDECDIDQGTSADCDNNAVPDECQLDCDNNGIPDACDIAANPQLDCNNNGVLDRCDLNPADPDGDGHVSEDCDGDEIPDECFVPTFAIDSPTLSPIYTGSPQTFTYQNAPPAGGPVTLTFAARGDLGALTEWIDVSINGLPVGRVFDTGATDCATDDALDSLVVANSAYNSVLGQGTVTITMTASAAVNSDVCATNTIRVSVAYDGIAPNDCNMNLVPDICDVLSGTSNDINNNLIPDECECDGDLTGDGAVDFADFAQLANCWNKPCGDLSGDALTDFIDFSILAATWGCTPP